MERPKRKSIKWKIWFLGVCANLSIMRRVPQKLENWSVPKFVWPRQLSNWQIRYSTVLISRTNIVSSQWIGAWLVIVISLSGNQIRISERTAFKWIQASWFVPIVLAQVQMKYETPWIAWTEWPVNLGRIDEWTYFLPTYRLFASYYSPFRVFSADLSIEGRWDD